MSNELNKKGRLNQMKKLSPLKVNISKHGYHSQSHSNILLTEPSHYKDNIGTIQQIAKNENQNVNEELKLRKIISLIDDLLLNGSIMIQNKLMTYCKQILEKYNKEMLRISNSNSTNNLFESKITDLNIKFDYLSKENSKLKNFINQKFEEMHSLYKEHLNVKKLDINKLKLLNPKRRQINISKIIKRQGGSEQKDNPFIINHTRNKRNKTKLDANNTSINNCDYSNLTFNNFNSFNFRTQTEVE